MENGMSRQVAICAAALAVAACSTTTEDGSMVSGGVGQGQIVGGVASGVQAVGSGVASGVQAVGSAVASPFTSGSEEGWAYVDENGVFRRVTRWGYYDENGVFMAFNDPRGAYCARWDQASNSCIWWMTG
jgi:hypothetical protein